jgi:hypothetical protein
VGEAARNERKATEEELLHYGTPRRSGRYPWGSGHQPEQRGKSFYGHVNDLRKQGMSDPAIAKALGLGSTTQLRARMAIEVSERRQADASHALRLKDKGMSTSAIARQMGKNESSVRALLNPALDKRRSQLADTADQLKGHVDKGSYLDIGKGAENWMHISGTRLSTAVAMLQEKGYEVHNVQIRQQFGKGKTTIKVLAAPGTKYVDIVRNMDNIKTLAVPSKEGLKPFNEIKPPVNVSSKRVGIRWKEDGGDTADGVIYVRPGVPDIALGASRYAQVRIAVDGTHFLKGMAMYKEGLPAGTDLVFNTGKSRSPNKLDAMKAQKDEKNPFKSVVDQIYYTGKDGKKHLSPMNIVNEEGDWRDWRPSLSSQVLSKQNTSLAKRQLDFALTDKVHEFDEIMNLTNPVVRKKLLDSFAESADAAAVHLKAAALPRQRSHVILPIPGLRENEIYAPYYKNGETVALVRHPHGGIFEIPELKVNNRNPEGKKALGPTPNRPPAIDAVGIHPSVAKKLSGADFDGDTVLVIPNTRRTLKTAPALEALKNFDHINMYPLAEGMKVMTNEMKQQHMGDVSNLITDMTIKGASFDEIARAVKHSMVVIDAENHKLNYKQSYLDNGIAELKARYQGTHPSGRLRGASTLISRASSEQRIPERIPRPAKKGGPVEAATGKKVFEPTGRTFVTRKGVRVPLTTRTTRLAFADDARNLISKEGMPMEHIYAAHSNSLKALANQARHESLRTGGIKHEPSATKAYAKEVARLNAGLNDALKARPLERQAQVIANHIVSSKLHDNPALKTDQDSLRKVKAQALLTARARMGSKKPVIVINAREWQAIQSGAITTNKLRNILDNADLDKLKKLATPRARTVMTDAKMSIAKARLASGYTQAEVAASLGIPVSTLNSALLSEGG